MTAKTTTAVANRAMSIATVEDVQDLLGAMKKRIAAILPAHLNQNPERLLRVVMNAWHKTPELRKCEPMSFLTAIMEAAYLGLEPDGLLGQGWIIPFGEGQGQNKRYLAKFIPGYRGLIQLGYRSNEISSWKADVVHAHDTWKYQEGLRPVLEHERTQADETGPVIAAYSIIQYKDGTADFEWMWLRELEKVRKKSRMAGGPAWTEWTEEMYKKTAIRRHAKRAKLSTEIQRAAQLDEHRELGLDMGETLLSEEATEELLGEVVKKEVKTIQDEKWPTPGSPFDEPITQEIAPETKDTTTDLIDQFKQSIPDAEDIVKVREYVHVCAQDNQMADEEFMANVAAENQVPAFWKNYKTWLAPQAKKEQPPPPPKKPEKPDPKDSWKTKTPDGSPLVYCVQRKRPLAPVLCEACGEKCSEFTNYQAVFGKK